MSILCVIDYCLKEGGISEVCTDVFDIYNNIYRLIDCIISKDLKTLLGA